MKLEHIVAGVNQLLAGERHSYRELIHFLDKTIDDINTQLQSTFPAFSEMPQGKAEYDYIPSRYIRQVVMVGAAWYYYTTDEEGIETAPQYGALYNQALSMMIRDFFNQVPEEYQQDHTTPLYPKHSEEQGERGVSVNGFSIIP